MTKTSYDWPRLYLLNLYRDAIERGHIVVEGISEEQAQSLKMAFYRLRRRSDSSNKTMILPEYHLVTCGEWRESPDNYITQAGPLLGTMSILYNSIPDGTLPLVRDATNGQLLPTALERSQPLPTAGFTVLPPADPLPMQPELAAALGTEVELSAGDISDYVSRLRQKAHGNG